MENAPIFIAIQKAVKAAVAKEARAGLEPGVYAIDATPHILGSIKVGEDYQQNIVQKAQPWGIVAGLLNVIEAAGIAGVDVARLAELAIVDNQSAAEVKKKVEDQIAATKEGTLTDCKGKVTTDLTITL